MRKVLKLSAMQLPRCRPIKIAAFDTNDKRPHGHCENPLGLGAWVFGVTVPSEKVHISPCAGPLGLLFNKLR